MSAQLMHYDIDANVPDALTLLIARLDAQTHQRDTITDKALGAAALSLVLTGVLFAQLNGTAGLAGWQWVAVAITIVLLTGIAALAATIYWPTEISVPPAPIAVVAQLDLPRAPRAWCDTLCNVFEDNQPRLKRKLTSLK